MTTTIEQVAQGITSDQMTLEELKTLAKENSIDLGKSTKKIDILAKVQEWENTLKPEGEEVVPVASGSSTVYDEPIIIEFHENKKVVSKRDVIINDKVYEEITVEGGIIFTELKK